jgi:hypothetical protein
MSETATAPAVVCGTVSVSVTAPVMVTVTGRDDGVRIGYGRR